MYVHKELPFQGVDGIDLSGQAWLPTDRPRAALVAVHGAGEYISHGRFGNVIDEVLPAGFAFYGADLRGHGKSAGPRGHVSRWGEYHADLRAFLDRIRRDQPNLPIFLWGFSLGALIALEYIETEPGSLRGAILMGTPNQPAEAAGPATILAAKALSRIWPTFRLHVALEPEKDTRDPSVIALDHQDAQLSESFTARWGAELLKTIDTVNAHPEKIQLPVLILHGGADRVNAVTGTQHFFGGIPFADKTMKVYPNCYHRLHYDLDHQQVIADMVGWMNGHLSG